MNSKKISQMSNKDDLVDNDIFPILDSEAITESEKNKSTKWSNILSKVKAFLINAGFWHSGNDGSGSGLDADKLDGYHASEMYVKTRTVCSAAGAGWYRVARLTVSDARGSYKFAIYTIGGDMTPYYTEVNVHKDWSTNCSFLVSVMTGSYWNAIRIVKTTDNKYYIELYITQQCNYIYLNKVTSIGHNSASIAMSSGPLIESVDVTDIICETSLKVGLNTSEGYYVNGSAVYSENKQPTWDEVTGKPTSFNPSEHTHTEYASSSHNHNGLYAPKTHPHLVAGSFTGVTKMHVDQDMPLEITVGDTTDNTFEIQDQTAMSVKIRLVATRFDKEKNTFECQTIEKTWLLYGYNNTCNLRATHTNYDIGDALCTLDIFYTGVLFYVKCSPLVGEIKVEATTDFQISDGWV